MRIAIISPNKNSYSETFIKAHLDLLKGEKYFLYGAYTPLYYLEKSILKFVPIYKRFIIKYIANKNLLHYSIRYFLLKNKISIILAEYGPTGCAILDIAKELKIPLIVHFHGYDASSIKIIDEYQKRYKKLFNYSRRIIAVSQHMKSRLIKLGAQEEKIIYNPCGPSSIFEDIIPNYDLSDSALFVGRFVNKKAPYLLIEIMNRIISRGNRKIKFVMAGDGELLDVCKNLVKIYSLEKYIFFTGAVKHTEVKKLMANSFCYIQHSITTSDGETEGTPVSILEASQAGLPVVSTIHGGISDVIIHDDTGFLVKEFDLDSMTDYILQLNGNRRLAREMGLRAKKRISENFSLEKHISILNFEIEKVANGD
jgi:glycosyltransferase involved in cell wall biosynthesis